MLFSFYFFEIINAKVSKKPDKENVNENEETKVKEYFDVNKNYKSKHRNKENTILVNSNSKEIDNTGKQKTLNFVTRERNGEDNEHLERKKEIFTENNNKNILKEKLVKNSSKFKYDNNGDNSVEDKGNSDEYDIKEEIKLSNLKSVKKLKKQTKDSDDDSSESEESKRINDDETKSEYDKKNGKRIKNKLEKFKRSLSNDSEESEESNESTQSCQKKRMNEDGCDEVEGKGRKKKIKYSIKFAHEKQKQTKVVDDDYILKKIHREHKHKR